MNAPATFNQPQVPLTQDEIRRRATALARFSTPAVETSVVAKPPATTAATPIYSAAVESCIRTAYRAVPEKKADVFKMMLRDALKYARAADLDVVEVIDRFQGVAEAIGLVNEFGQDAVQRWIADANTPVQESYLSPLVAVLQLPPATPTEAVSNGRSLVTCTLSDIAPEKIEWLWPGRIAVGKLTLIAGEPGLGKSQTTLFVAAAVTTGERWPDDSGAAPLGSVIILSAEDGLADTTRPRFDAAGGDASRVGVIRAVETTDAHGSVRGSFNLAADLVLLEAEIIKRGDVRLVIIDPVSSYMGKTDSHKNADVRSVLEPIGEMAERLRVAVLAITHLSKGDGKAINRFIGSIAFVAAARAAFTVVADAEDDAGLRRLFLQVKNNIAPPAPGLAFRLEQREVAPGIIGSSLAWDSTPVTMTADQALGGGGDDGGHTAKDDAADFLCDVLAAGPLPAKDIERLAAEAGLLGNGKPIGQTKAFRLARKDLGIVPARTGGLGSGGQWVWALPTPKMPSNTYDALATEEGTLGSEGHLRPGGMV
jgi:hypothetical protein